ncbi:MAG: polyphosphate polymerase domain-containing protein [Bacteroidetes bacterium]|nr:polyphosphate polymerase domain-containing protein [Bacteroidota bacterium]
MPYPKLEYKYLLPLDRIPALRRSLLLHMQPDKYAKMSPDLEYTVRSVYLDTPRFAAYREKVEGVRVRRKYRIRAYNDASAGARAFLEIKEKVGAYLTKYRCGLAVDAIGTLIADRDFDRHVEKKHGDGIHPANAERFFRDYDRKALRPVALIVYDREAYTVNGFGDLRVTIDKHLRAARTSSPDALYSDGALLPVMRQHCILEVKFTRGVPGWLRAQLEQYQLRRLALSKYTLSLDAHAH